MKLENDIVDLHLEAIYQWETSRLMVWLNQQVVFWTSGCAGMTDSNWERDRQETNPLTRC